MRLISERIIKCFSPTASQNVEFKEKRDIMANSMKFVEITMVTILQHHNIIIEYLLKCQSINAVKPLAVIP